MKKVDEKDALLRKELQKLPNVGPRVADDLVRLGIRRTEDLAKRDPDEMYQAICTLDAVRHDPCVWDVFASVVEYARNGRPRKWWEFTVVRKKRDSGPNPTPAAPPAKTPSTRSPRTRSIKRRR